MGKVAGGAGFLIEIERKVIRGVRRGEEGAQVLK